MFITAPQYSASRMEWITHFYFPNCRKIALLSLLETPCPSNTIQSLEVNFTSVFHFTCKCLSSSKDFIYINSYFRDIQDSLVKILSGRSFLNCRFALCTISTVNGINSTQVQLLPCPQAPLVRHQLETEQ